MDLTQEPIPRLIRRIAVPASVGFFFNTMFNVVDTYFAGFISTHALAALSLSFPVFFIILAMGAGVGQGGTALIANALGEKSVAKAHHICFQCLSFGALLSAALTAIGLAAAPTLFRILGADGAYLDMSLDYMNVVVLGTVFFVLQSIFNAALNAQGDTSSFRNVLIAGFVLNCFLDPWFMFGGAGLPAMGLGGVGLATVIVQALGCAYLARKLSKTPLWEGRILSSLKPSGVYREIARQGIPASFNMVTVALGIFVITWFVSQFSTEGVAAYGIATRIEQIALLPTIGLNIAVLSLTGQNNGARRYSRVRETWTATMTYGVAMMAASGAAIFVFARPLMAFFTRDEAVIGLGSDYLRVASITLCSYVILFQTVFLLQGLKRPMYAIWIGLYRQIVAPCAVFYVLAFALDWKLDGIWWGVFLVTWSAALITFFYGRFVLRSLPADDPGDTMAG